MSDYRPGDPVRSQPFLPALVLLFVGSGCAALIYEIVWFQLLQLVIGSSAVSLGVLLGTFMGGMCLGSLVLPRIISIRRHPLRVYAVLELGIGLCGLAVLFGMPYIERLYTVNLGYGLQDILARGAVCGACLLLPTVLMGATLPAIARWIETTPRGISWLGFFYGGNIAGAVFGCLLAGFYLLRVHDMTTATYVAAAINCAVAAIALALAVQSRDWTPHSQPTLPDSEPGRGDWTPYVAIGLSGMCALGAEVVWTRLLSLMLGGTVYTFSIILAVFLAGLGIGSSVGSVLARTVRPRIALGVCQLLVVAAIAWAATMLAESLPYWPVDSYLTISPWFNFQLDLVRCAWAILPAAVLWGASFPLALAAAASRGQDAGRLVGKVYAANTVGAIVGAIAASVFLVGWLGTQGIQQLLIGLSALAAMTMFVPCLWSSRTKADGVRRTPLRVLGSAACVLAAAGLAGLLAWSVPEAPGGLVAYGRQLPGRYWEFADGKRKLLYVGEGMNSSVAVTESAGVRNFHVSGKVEASSDPSDMRLQRMLGHLPALLHPKPKSVLVVGCGAGVTAGSFTLHPEVERIVICEIEPLIPQVVASHFEAENYRVVSDPRVEIIYDDARHYIRTTEEKFDIITSDPIHPWVKGAASLYTQEYFELCKQHLNPGGLVTQWVPLYESDVQVVKSEMATFFETFPEGTVWSNDIEGEGYDVVMLGAADDTKVDADGLQDRLDRADHERVVQSLEEVGFRDANDLLATWGWEAADLSPWLADAEINRDANLRLQYLAGLGLNSDQSRRIFREMTRYMKPW